MKKLSVIICVHLWAIFLCFSISAQDFRLIRDGIEYAEMTRGTKEEPVHINLLRLDLTKVRLDVAHAMDAAIGLEKTSSIAARYGAFAAINAGFFRLDRSIFAGDAAGILKIDGKILSESNNHRIALFITNKPDKTEVDFFHLTIWAELALNKGAALCGESLTGINRERRSDDFVLYTPEFHRTTLTNQDGVEIVFQSHKVTQVVSGKGSTVIPPDGFVLSASGRYADKVKNCKIGTKIRGFEFSDYDKSDSSRSRKEIPTFEIFPTAEDIVGGVPQLIKNGRVEITWEQEKSSKEFVETRHPRTAVAKLGDGKFLMVTVDGRQPGYSVGMNLNELAAFLLEIGATDAMNLDGGGSTTMFLDAKVVNRPSDKEGERSVSDAILIFPRKRN